MRVIVIETLSEERLSDAVTQSVTEEFADGGAHESDCEKAIGKAS